MENLSGFRFGRLSVKSFVRQDQYYQSYWLCLCSCGVQKTIRSNHLTSGRVVSCGCHRREQTQRRSIIHGHDRVGQRSGTYHSWCSMLTRCYNEKHVHWEDYGGRGIRVCKRWLNSFENFLADMGERPKDKTLDRKNNDGDYKPSNCRWATRKQQTQNQRPRRS